MRALTVAMHRVPYQRTTLYTQAPAERVDAAMAAGPLKEVVNAQPRRRQKSPDRHLVRFGQG
jgi:hypothetical protein